MSFPPKGDEFNVQHPQEVHQGELTNMKAQLGKQTGIALALLATLLATLFAMGVFSVALADTHSATRSFDPDPVARGGDVTVSIALANYPSGGVVEETYPAGYTLVSAGDFTQRGNDHQVAYIISAAGESSTVSYTVMAPTTPGESDVFSGIFLSDGVSVNIGGDSTFTVSAPTTNGGNGDGNGDNGNGETGASIKLSSQEPGAAVQITISDSTAAAIMPNQDIQVDLSAFSVPDTIADSAIDISSDGFDGNPSNVVVSGSKVTMTVPNVKANGDDQTENVVGNYSIRIKQSAGVTNAASGGSKTVNWQENAPDGEKKNAKVTIDRVVKLSATGGTRGTMTTATFKGFANGSATVNLNGAKLDEVMIADNTGTLEIDTTSSKFMANRDGGNEITAQDAAGNNEDVSGTFTISPKVVLDPEETSVSKMVTVKLSDWPATNGISEVKIGATTSNPTTSQSTDGDGKAEFMVLVPSNVNRGTQTVKVTGTDPAPDDDDVGAPSATASLKVGVLSLSAQPAMVVPGQQITIQGSGFVANDSFSSVMVGGIPVAISGVTASSAGDIVITINVPSPSGDDSAGIGSGKKTISVTATGSNRVAEGSIEIPKAAITLDPVTSRRGTTVSVSGSGFPSGDLVQVKYDNNGTSVTVAAGSADASGAVSIDFVVPSYARIGTKHDVAATSVGVYKPVTAKASHETPGAMVTLSTQQIASGQNITISGMNFPAFATVAVMEIGGVDVRPVPAPATSINGDFESEVLVPQLELGNQTVSVRVSSTTITTFLELGTVAVTTAPADVFGGLGDRLVRVWYLDRATQEWSFYDPDPEVAAFNTLTEVSGGQIVTIIVGEGDSVGFQGGTLFAGSNPVSLN